MSYPPEKKTAFLVSAPTFTFPVTGVHQDWPRVSAPAEARNADVIPHAQDGVLAIEFMRPLEGSAEPTLRV